MKDKAYFAIRLGSLGGLGANLCGKMLGELGVKYLGLNGAAFSSYGSEKRGSPVSSFTTVHLVILLMYTLCVSTSAELLLLIRLLRN